MPRTKIRAGTRILGAIVASDELVIEGAVEGPVTGESTVTLAAGARVDGEVRGREVVIAAAHKHDVHASEAIRLLSTAEVTGNLFAPRLAVEEGALLEGRVTIVREKFVERRAADSPMRVQDSP